MKIKCDYCGNTYEDTLHQCPDCGAPNPSHKNEKGPKTIEELQQWYKNRNLPAPEVTRFFIGVDYKEPRAFGIYKDGNGDFIVYKNKGDGSRAVRYQGKDEEYAVNELYQRLKDEIVHQKANNKGGGVTRSGGGGGFGSGGRSGSGGGLFNGIRSLFYIVVVIIMISVFVSSLRENRHRGYYSYDNDIYYYISDDWYVYDDGWREVSSTAPGPATISENYDEYYVSDTWDSSMGTTDWDESSYYDRYHSSNDDNDSDYDWGSDDSWDSGGTDWDSDW